MVRVSRSPDEPMLVEQSSQRKSGSKDVVLCAGSTSLHELLPLIPSRTITVEIELAAAMSRCLEGNVSLLVVDVTAVSPSALSALGHLRLIRPEQEILLIHSEEEPPYLDATMLGSVPVVAIRRQVQPPKTNRL